MRGNMEKRKLSDGLKRTTLHLPECQWAQCKADAEKTVLDGAAAFVRECIKLGRKLVLSKYKRG